MTYIRSDRAKGWKPDAYEAARVHRRLTYAQLAKFLDVSESTAHNWAKKTSPPHVLLYRIARALRVQISALASVPAASSRTRRRSTRTTEP